ncbi:GAF domain-containing protein [Natronolimnobius sp. AArcel1]|uniref:bacterio-opsin activator domain-containing protein n=1 Tax=Natronolimnobius sp. AArcel1 TaxID=1679093 RepID=UPI0013EBE251|nr:bacterio-opsin activator domain-containing protein [Natronolimnobius sp. AArcel1]NGM68598.1 GAF domain-containing protein [Natronolimnobius sp. AArcel1]
MSPVPTPDEVFDVFVTLGPPGTPFTTPEVAEEFDCTDRTIYNRLETLVEGDRIQTKKVGAKGRVWWQPVESEQSGSVGLNGDIEQLRSLPVFDSNLIGVIVWGEDITITDANDAFLEMAGLDYQEALGTSWRDLTPEAFYSTSERHLQEVEETGSGVPYEKQYYHADGSRWWGLFESRRLNESEKVEFVVDITERKQRERLLKAQKELLELIATDAPLETCLSALCAAVPRLGTGVRASIMLADDERDSFQRPIAPDLQPSWGDGLEDAPINDLMIGTCGEAVFRGDGITCEDVTTDDRWSEEWRELCVANDVLAGRSEPIRNASGEPLGSFMLCFDEPRGPTEWERQVTDFGTYIAGIAVEREHSRRALLEVNNALERLNEATRELIDADTETIADRVAPLAREVLDVECAALWRYDDRNGELEEHAVDTAGTVDVDTVEVTTEVSDAVWQTFVGTSGVHVEPDLDGQDDGSSPLGSFVTVPLGRHGVLWFGSPGADSFDDRMGDLAKATAASVETAWNRAEGEQRLAERNEELKRLDRLNALIRGVHQQLVDADSREVIERAVVDQFADSDLYEFAWVGTREPGTDTIIPRAWAGVDDGYLETLSIRTNGTTPDEDPMAAAIRTGDLQVVGDVAIDPRAASWREPTLERGVRSCIAVPLRYNGTAYGVLAVYTARLQPDERDNPVLAELGETIAHAIDAVETKRTLLTDSVTELTLEIYEGDTVLVKLAQEIDSEITFDGLVPLNGGAARLFFTAHDVTAKQVRDVAHCLPGVAAVTLLREAETESEFKLKATEPTVASHVVKNGGIVRSLTVTGQAITVVVDQPANATVREFVETIQAEYPSADLVARHSRDRSIKTPEDLRVVLSERLTARQREILEMAYRSGYFESPRIRTGRDLSEALDVTQSTFSHHLREGERRLCELVFDRL